jgi:hypothetical protein
MAMREKTALKIYRQMNPRARRTEATAIIHSGGRRRIYDCICGSRITMASQWPVTVRVKTWRALHRACLVKWAQAHR